MSLNYQIHHIYPLEIFNEFGNELAKSFGVKDPKSLIQSYNNRIALFTDPAMARQCRISTAWADITYHHPGSPPHPR